MKSGYSLSEMIVAVTIISLLVAIMAPAFFSARSAALESTCWSNLRQLHNAVVLYQTDNDGVGSYGDAETMGLPPSISILRATHRVPLETYRCTGRSWAPWSHPAVYHSMWQSTSTWADYAIEHRDGSILIIDLNHQSTSVSVFSPFATHRGIGIHLDGHVQIRKGVGDPFAPEWWTR